MKDARTRVYSLKQDKPSQQFTEIELIYHNCAMRYFYNLIMTSQGHEESRKILWNSTKQAKRKL